jgi:hypothetical protein
MRKTTQSMIVLLVFAAAAIGGLWFYLQPGKATDTLAQANDDLARIGRNLDELEVAASHIAARVKPGGVAQNQPTSQAGGADMVLTNLDRPKCREVLTRLLRSSGEIGSTVWLNGQPARSADRCRAADNRVEVVM